MYPQSLLSLFYNQYRHYIVYHEDMATSPFVQGLKTKLQTDGFYFTNYSYSKEPLPNLHEYDLRVCFIEGYFSGDGQMKSDFPLRLRDFKYFECIEDLYNEGWVDSVTVLNLRPGDQAFHFDAYLEMHRFGTTGYYKLNPSELLEIGWWK